MECARMGAPIPTFARASGLLYCMVDQASTEVLAGEGRKGSPAFSRGESRCPHASDDHRAFG